MMQTRPLISVELLLRMSLQTLEISRPQHNKSYLKQLLSLKSLQKVVIVMMKVRKRKRKKMMMVILEYGIRVLSITILI